MTTTDPTTGTPEGPTALPPLRPGRDETARLAARVNVAPGRETRTVTSPLTGAVVGEVPVGTAEDVTAAFGRAREAQRRWALRPLRERAAVLLRYHDLVLDHQDELLDLIQAENGKARVWAFEEIMDQAVTARYYARLAPRALRPHRRLSALPGLVSSVGPPRAQGRRRGHLAVELPAGARHVRRPGRPGGGQRGRAQARLADPVHRAAGVRAAGGGGPAVRAGPGRDRARGAASAPPSSRRRTT